MELRQLKYFVKVAETLNFSEAAKALFITQSTLSQQIMQLEQEVKAQLFQRNHHSVWLTEAGEQMLPYARQTLQSAQTCLDRIHDLKNLQVGTLNIGVTYSFSHILTETLLKFIKRYPKVKLNIYYKPMEELLQMLEHNDIDFALTFRPLKAHPKIDSQSLFDNHLAVILRDDHPLASRETIDVEELQGYEMALPARGLQARNSFELMLAEHPCNLDVKVETNEVTLLLDLVKQKGMLSVLSETTICDTEGMKAIPIDLSIKEMDGCVHQLKDIYHKRSAQEFISMLKGNNN